MLTASHTLPKCGVLMVPAGPYGSELLEAAKEQSTDVRVWIHASQLQNLVLSC